MMDHACVRWVVFWTAALFVVPGALATTWNTPDVDGVPPLPNPDGGFQAARDTTWANDELLFEDPLDDSAWGSFNDLQGVWVTWDDQGITFAVQGAVWDVASGIGANSVNLYIDVDYGQGTGYGDLATLDQNALDAITRNFWRPLVIEGGFGVDWGYTCWAGRYDLGFLDVRDPDAPVNLLAGLDGVSSPANTTAEGVIEARDHVGNAGYELFVPWYVFYPDEDAGRVPAGTQIAVAVAQVGGGDSLSPESIPDGADDRLIERPLVFTVDGDGDGLPDQNWPPNGTITGSVTLNDVSDTTSVVEVVVYPQGSETIVGRADAPPGGGTYTIERLQPGPYRVEVNALDFCAAPQITNVIENVDAVVDFAVDRAESGFGFSLGFADGPEATNQVSNIVLHVERVFDGRVVADEVLVPGADTTREFRLCDGDYTVEVYAENGDQGIGTNTGYTRIAFTQTVSGSGLVDLGTLALELVQPTRLVFVDALSDGGEIEVVRIPKSERITVDGEEDGAIDFDLSQFVRGAIEVAAVDDDGNEAWLTDGFRDEIDLVLTSIDPRWPADGVFDFWAESDTTRLGTDDVTLDLLTLSPTIEGRTRARFLLSGSVRQVARLRATHPAASIATGDLEVAITAQLPAAIDLAIESLSIDAGDSTGVTATVLDVLSEPIRSADQRLDFEVSASGGRARVIPNPAFTDQEGMVGADGDLAFTSTLADTFEVYATVDNGIEIVESDRFQVVVAPATAELLRVSPQVTALDTVRVEVQVTDRFGNASSLGASRSATVAVGPSELVTDSPTIVQLDASGFGSFEVAIVPNLPGVLDVSVTDPSLATATTRVDFALTAGLAGIDEPAPESTEPNASPLADLTTFATSIRGDDLVITIPFASSVSGLHIGMAFDVDQTTTGAVSDPFVFPITYAHEFLPDFGLTYKVSAGDYGDFRRWNVGANAWEWYIWDSGTFSPSGDGGDIVAAGRVDKTEDEVVFRLPMNALAPGFRPGVDTMRAQVYVMREEPTDNKSLAFDSIPQDDTLDMILGTDDALAGVLSNFDSYNPYLTNGATTLTRYVEFSPREIGNSLAVDTVGFTPETTTQGEDLLITVEPGFPDGEGPANPIFQVFANLSTLGGDAAARMNDDGQNGDVAAGDGIYSIVHTVPVTQFGGAVDVVIRTLELTSAQEVFASGTIEVIGDPELLPLISIEDVAGDDHGPNQQGRDFLYYIQPTNGVFFDGVFDLRRLDVFDLGERLLFRVTIGDLTDPNETSSADWGATYPSDTTCPEGERTDLNLQNLVVLIDSQDGINTGSTRIPDNRRADVAPQDAWDHALVYDGWWKGVVSSRGSADAGDWNIGTADAEFYFCANATANTIDGFVSKDVFTDDELEKILNWDLIVMLSGHDGDSNKDNWGQVRWVNDDVSEWNFGGGRNSEDGRDRDPNIIDLMTLNGFELNAPDTRKAAGRTQEEQMDFLTPEARSRFARSTDQVNAVQLEATEFFDLDPPNVSIVGAIASRAVVPEAVLEDGPVVVRANIDDESGVEDAQMYWWAPGETPADRRVVPMGKLRGDLDPTSTEFAGDIPWTEVAAATADGVLTDPEGLADTYRYIYVTVEATDIAGNSTVAATGTEADRFAAPEVIELPVEAATTIRYTDLLSGTDTTIRIDLNEGSLFTIDRSVLVDAVGDSTAQVDLVLRTIPIAEIDAAFRTSDNATVLGPDNRFLGIARRLELEEVDGTSTTTLLQLPEAAQISFHFPRYLQGDEQAGELTLFRLEEIDAETQRWILAAGHGEEDGSTITVRTDRLGSYAGFTTPVEIDNERYVTGLLVTPNPFTPNGDGHYDEVDISYVLPEATNWAVVEVYDIRGEKVRVLQKFTPDEVTNRTLSLTWDGRDEGGRLVPMGLYVVRVEVQSRSEGRVERATRAVAVVR